MDGHIGYCLTKFESTGILDTMNIVLVSDHGMAQMKTNNTILAKDYINMNLVDEKKTIWGITANIYPKNETVVRKIFLFCC